jgi:uncharacterized tellurite resistance protein B-like protein
MTLGQGELDFMDLEQIADLLMGAAYADGSLEGSERQAVERILGDLISGDDLPAGVVERIERFDPADYDPAVACSVLALPERADKRALLALLARVSDADDIHDLDEGAYIRRVAELVGADPEDCSGLAVEVVHVRRLSQPPPVPES